MDGVSVAVLAGGRSRRFGSDKRLLPLDGTTLLGRTLALASALSSDVLLVVADAADVERVAPVIAAHRGEVRGEAGGEVRVVTDTRSDTGPLAGLEAALGAAHHELVLVLAGDHPRLGADLLTLLLDTARAHPQARAVTLAGPLGPEPLLAVHRRASLAEVSAALDAGTRRMVDVLDLLDAHIIDEATWRAYDMAGDGLVDIDTPGDLS
jgi:molybdopterin-guanine dinucleotide biosynthesis protein A